MNSGVCSLFLVPDIRTGQRSGASFSKCWLARRLGSCRSALRGTESTIERHARFAPDQNAQKRPTDLLRFRIQRREHLRPEWRKVSESVVTGFLIDPLALAHSLTSGFCLAAGIIGALLVGKWIAAEVLGGAFGYSPAARRTM
jgi:hypothetical protein